MTSCICCGGKAVFFVRKAQEVSFDYFECQECGSLFIDPAVIKRMDGGERIYHYEESYWTGEVESARQRSFGPSLARMAELVYYTRIPIRQFLDIGTGPGFFLDAIEKYLPSKREHFFGVEKFPPEEDKRTKSGNYIVGEVKDLQRKFEAGMCIEVIEHLTPTMLRELFRSLEHISVDGSCFLINTGLPPYVRREDPNYLDPFVRGHIVSYSLKAIAHLSREFGFTVIPLKGKTWAFLLEYHSASSLLPEHRIWNVVPENQELLSDPEMGSVLQILAIDTARAY